MFMNDFIYKYIISTENERINCENYNENFDQEKMNRYEELVFDLSSEIENQIIKSNESLSKYD